MQWPTSVFGVGISPSSQLFCSIPHTALSPPNIFVVWKIEQLVPFKKAISPDRKKKIYKLLVFIYHSRGNIKGKIATPYEAGEPCGHCPNDCDKGLCSKFENVKLL